MNFDTLFARLCVPTQSGRNAPPRVPNPFPNMSSPSTSLPSTPSSTQKMFVAILAKSCGLCKRLREHNFQSQMETYLSEKGMSSVFINVDSMSFGRDLELPRILAKHVTAYPMFMYMDVSVWNDMVSGVDWSSKITIMNYDNVSNSFKLEANHGYSNSYLGVTKWIESLEKKDDNPFTPNDYLTVINDSNMNIEDKYKKILNMMEKSYSDMPESVKTNIQPYIRYNYIVFNRILSYKKIGEATRNVLVSLVQFCEDKVDKTKSFDDNLIKVDIVTLSRMINNEDIEKEDKREVIVSLLDDWSNVLPEEAFSIIETYKGLVHVLF